MLSAAAGADSARQTEMINNETTIRTRPPALIKHLRSGTSDFERSLPQDDNEGQRLTLPEHLPRIRSAAVVQ
jgi:hypothetical protein